MMKYPPRIALLVAFFTLPSIGQPLCSVLPSDDHSFFAGPEERYLASIISTAAPAFSERRSTFLEGNSLSNGLLDSLKPQLISSDRLVPSLKPLAGYRPPSNWNGVAIVGGIALTALLFETDQRTYDALNDWGQHHAVIHSVAPIITDLGDGAVSLGLFGGFVGYGLAFNNNKMFDVGKIGLESFAVSGIVVQLLKHISGRERPSASTTNGGYWHGPFAFFRQNHDDRKGLSSFDAFPSGHTASAFAAATTLSDLYRAPWVSYVSYTLASGVGISRITEDTHWASDVFVGALIGIFSTRIVEMLNYNTTDVSLFPVVDEYRYGVALSVKL